MLRRVFPGLTTALVAIALALPAMAAPADDLLRALRMPEMLQIMREEGVAYGEEMAQDMFPGGGNPEWDRLVAEIYDVDKMATVVRRHFAESLGETDTDALRAYFNAEAGRRIVDLELSARRAMVDDDVEQAARDAFRAIESTEEDRLDQIEAFIEANDLIEANVEGALNASFQFYRGLVDGGAFVMTESDILRDVWEQEENTRADTREWLFAFLLLAYGPLGDAELAEYIALSATPEGQALNRALFAGYNRMYDELSYALGLAAAQQMKTQDL